MAELLVKVHPEAPRILALFFSSEHLKSLHDNTNEHIFSQMSADVKGSKVHI